MSKKSEERLDFSYTQFLVEGMKEIREDLDNKMFKEALDDIYWGLIPFLDMDIQDKLEDEEKQIEAIIEHANIQAMDPYTRAREGRIKEELESRKIIRPILKKMMRLIHEAGYFWDARRGLFIPSGDRKSGEGTYPGAPRIMSSDV